MRLFWGRETLDMAGEPTEYAPETAAVIRRINEVWHEYPEAFATPAPGWLIPTLVRGVYANYFAAEDYGVYVLFNDLPYTAEGTLIEVIHPEGASYREAWEDVALMPRVTDGVARISLSIPPKSVRVVVVE
jgi:hypothetical protein